MQSTKLFTAPSERTIISPSSVCSILALVGSVLSMSVQWGQGRSSTTKLVARRHATRAQPPTELERFDPRPLRQPLLLVPLLLVRVGTVDGRTPSYTVDGRVDTTCVHALYTTYRAPEKAMMLLRRQLVPRPTAGQAVCQLRLTAVQIHKMLAFAFENQRLVFEIPSILPSRCPPANGTRRRTWRQPRRTQCCPAGPAYRIVATSIP